MKDFVDFVLTKSKKPLSYEEIISSVEVLLSEKNGYIYNLTENEKNSIQNILDFGVNNYEYILNDSKYFPIMKTDFRKGVFYADRNGNGKVSVSSSYTNRNGELVVLEDKYMVYKDKANGAIDGDVVLIDLSSKNIKVEKIIERHLEHVLGEVYRVGKSYFVKPLDKKKQNVIISLDGEAIEGQRVDVELIGHGENNYYVGKIVKEFGHKDDPDDDIIWEAYKFGIDNEISSDSKKQLEYIPTVVRDVDKIGREDLTNWEIFTIDGIDTKDMDDAISCFKNEEGNYILGVHITDIASLIPENSPLDKDAFRKGNSYYLGGKVFPMFDHKISNGIGSLNPHVERLTISVIMEIDSMGNLINYRIVPSIIKSCEKMSYDKVNSIFKGESVDNVYLEHKDTLNNMAKLALILRKNRIRKGAISFDRPESNPVYDENGNIIDFSLRNQDVAEELIEEFMLIANETVDKHLTKNGLPCVHRVHEMPDPEKIDRLLCFLDAISLPYNYDNPEVIANSNFAFQRFANFLKSTGSLSNLLTTEGVRCMSRAKYSPYPIGHYGLAKDEYCHFTSPVRRYADLTQQRILWDCVFNKDDLKKKCIKWKKILPGISERTSYTERVADDAERDVFRMQYCEFMRKHIGDTYEATITGIYADSFDIQLDNLIDGKVMFTDLDGKYVVDDENYSLISLDGFDNYSVGDRIVVRVKEVSEGHKRVFFDNVKLVKDSKNFSYRKKR